MTAASKLLALTWALVLAGVGMRWPALTWGSVAAFAVVAGLWCFLFARRPP